MKLLANENVPRQVVERLRGAGYDVLWALTDMSGAIDRVVLARAQAEERILLTFDKVFGELAFRTGLPSTCGVILFRLPLPSPEVVADRVLGILSGRTDWPGHFAVVEPDRIRLSSMPLPEVGL